MSNKLQWEDVYKDFRTRHPNLCKGVVYWCPHDYAVIKIFFDDGKLGIYSYLEHKVVFLKECWAKDEVTTA